MRHILYIGNKLSNSGSNVTSIETLGSFLQNEGYEVVMASSKKNKILRLLDMLFTTIKYSNKVSLVLIDTYSTQNFYYSILVAQVCRILNLAYIPILRGGMLPDRLEKSSKLCKKLFNNAKTNVSPSNYLMEAFKKEGYTNLTYIPNTIEIDNYPFFERKNIKAKLLWVRSFSEIYNPLLAIKIVEKLLDKNITVKLCMIGPEKDGSLSNCKEIAEQKSLPIIFTGKLEKAAWIEQSKHYDIFINTTNFDNTPVSVMEAMALGLPVISTNVGGLPFLIDHQKTGVLVPPNDKFKFVDAIMDLIENPKKAQSLATNARAAVENFDWEKVKHHWFRVLNE